MVQIDFNQIKVISRLTLKKTHLRFCLEYLSKHNLFQMTVTIKGSGEEAQRVKAFMHNFGRGEIRKQLQEYLRSLKEEFSKGTY